MAKPLDDRQDESRVLLMNTQWIDRQTNTCDAVISNGEGDEAYCGLPHGHAGECGKWWN